MITKNISKHRQLFQASINCNNLTFDTSKLTYQCKFFFSRNLNKKPNQNKQKTQKTQSNTSQFQINKNVYKPNPKYPAPYLKRLMARGHFSNGPLLKRLNSLNNIFTKLDSISSLYKYSLFKQNSKLVKNKYFIFFVQLALSLILSKLFLSNFFKNNEQSKTQKLNIQLNQANKNQYLQDSAKLQQIILNLKKIYIISQSTFNSGDQNDETQESNQKHPIRKVVYYKIIMEDKSGQKYVANPYQGDPNNLLKYIEHIQQKYHQTQRVDVFFDNKQTYSIGNAFSDALGFVTMFIPVAITIYLFRRMDPTSILKGFGKGVKQFKIQAMKDIKTRFKDVAGMEQSKKQITQFVDFLKNNQKYKQMGAKIPKGALLTGPPGTGKTMLARACAGEAGVSFFYISGSEFVQVFVGLGASKVRDLFAKARQNAPSIIFIDQIDAIGKKRQTSRNEEKDSTLNQLLVQMDGFSTSETIIVLAATNRKQILDNALTRPGRFDRLVQINLPDVKARQQIFMVHLAPLKIDPTTELKVVAKRLSELTPGFSGADIANLCNEAAIIATRKNRNFIIDKDFEQATERITAGYVKKNLMKQNTKKRVAYHQAGHAVAGWFLKGGDPLVKLTIIPRSKGSLGYAQYLPKSTYIAARSQLIDKIAIMLGGITTQQIFFGDITSGGSDDLQKVYSLTRRMVTQFGMGNSTYNITIDQQSYIQKQSIFLTDKMQEEVASILQESKRRSREIIESKRDIIQALAKQLIQKQTLNSLQILKIMGQRPDFGAVKKSQALV